MSDSCWLGTGSAPKASPVLQVGGQCPQWLNVPHASFQVRLMITDAARHKLLVLTGQCFENTGELILQSGSFSFQNFIEIFTDQEVGSCLGVSMLYSCLVIVVALG